MSDLARIRSALLARLAAIEQAGSVDVRVERDTPVASATDQDLAPYLEMEQAIASSRNRQAALEVERLHDALRRMQEDSDGYGICEGCEEEIPPRRLELMPHARQCVACESKGEARNSGRKKVTDYL